MYHAPTDCGVNYIDIYNSVTCCINPVLKSPGKPSVKNVDIITNIFQPYQNLSPPDTFSIRVFITFRITFLRTSSILYGEDKGLNLCNVRKEP